MLSIHNVVVKALSCCGSTTNTRSVMVSGSKHTPGDVQIGHPRHFTAAQLFVKSP